MHHGYVPVEECEIHQGLVGPRAILLLLAEAHLGTSAQGEGRDCWSEARLSIVVVLQTVVLAGAMDVND